MANKHPQVTIVELFPSPHSNNNNNNNMNQPSSPTPPPTRLERRSALSSYDQKNTNHPPTTKTVTKLTNLYYCLVDVLLWDLLVTGCSAWDFGPAAGTIFLVTVYPRAFVPTTNEMPRHASSLAWAIYV